MTASKAVIASLALALGAPTAITGTAVAADPAKSVVLVHGAFVDGSGWHGVHRVLTERGYDVTVVQNTTESLEADVAATRRAIAAAKGDVILVGHSYGGVVVSEAGNDPKVSGLVFIAAFPADAGESLATIKLTPRADDAVAPVLPPKDGYLVLDREKFPEAFAGDVEPSLARFMADSQLPWNVAARDATVTTAAWKTRPSWYLVATEDRMVSRAHQLEMAARAGSTVVEVQGSHALFVSKPEAVAAVIEQAAEGAGH